MGLNIRVAELFYYKTYEVPTVDTYIYIHTYKHMFSLTFQVNTWATNYRVEPAQMGTGINIKQIRSLGVYASMHVCVSV